MTVRGGAQLKRRVQKIKDNLKDEVVDAAEDGLDKTERRAKRRIVSNDAVFTTEMYRGFRQRRYPVVKDRGPATRLTLTNTADHAKYQEWGTGGHFGEANHWGFEPPSTPYKAPQFSLRLVIAISTWIAKKPGFRRAGPGRDKAVPIARSIAFGSESDPRPGTPAQPFMRPAWFLEKQTMKADIRFQAKKVLRG